MTTNNKKHTEKCFEKSLQHASEVDKSPATLEGAVYGDICLTIKIFLRREEWEIVFLIFFTTR